VGDYQVAAGANSKPEHPYQVTQIAVTMKIVTILHMTAARKSTTIRQSNQRAPAFGKREAAGLSA
jgi:hypothetical protein